MKLYLKMDGKLTLTQYEELEKYLKKSKFEIVEVDLIKKFLYLRANCSADYLKLTQDVLKDQTGVVMSFHLEIDEEEDEDYDY